MEISCDELEACGGMHKSGDCRNLEWGFGNLGRFGEDDLFNTMLGGQMSNALFNDLLSFGEEINVLTSLPEDPFCMNNIRSTLNSISDWWFHETQIGVVDNFSTLLQQQKVSTFKMMNGFEGLCGEATLPDDPFSMKVITTFKEEDKVSDSLLPTHLDDDDDGGEEPHSAFDLVLPYLEMRDLLAVEGVCRSLRGSVRKESSFLWRTIDLSGDSPLKYRVTDDSLLKLTRRAQGRLQCLNLGGCVSITDNGLVQVLATNPHLTKV